MTDRIYHVCYWTEDEIEADNEKEAYKIALRVRSEIDPEDLEIKISNISPPDNTIAGRKEC